MVICVCVSYLSHELIGFWDPLTNFPVQREVTPRLEMGLYSSHHVQLSPIVDAPQGPAKPQNLAYI